MTEWQVRWLQKRDLFTSWFARIEPCKTVEEVTDLLHTLRDMERVGRIKDVTVWERSISTWNEVPVWPKP